MTSRNDRNGAGLRRGRGERVMIVTAGMGGGHNQIAAELQASARSTPRGARGRPAGRDAATDLWIHPSADLELTISGAAAAEARRRSGRSAVVVGPVVRPEFHQPWNAAQRAALRRGWGLGPADRAALIVTGSLGFAGAAEQAVTAIARRGFRPVVVAGRNGALRERLDRRGDAIVFGWVDDMRTLMAACDVVIDNACGTTAKEALRLGVPVVTFRPIAGHGRDDALAMAALGLTELVDDEHALEAALTRVLHPRTRAARIGRGKELFVGDAAAHVAEAARGHAARPAR